MSKENAGELLLHNLRRTRGESPYLSDLLTPSSFPDNFIVKLMFNNEFSEKGYVNVAGSRVELQIIHNGWIKNYDTQLSRYKMSKSINEIRIASLTKRNVIIYRFGTNTPLFLDISNYLGGGEGPNFYYPNPYY